jgi:tRNA threonylcarbamoyladenosine biosynthesis protein TsaE
MHLRADVQTRTEIETRKIARSLARELRADDIVALTGPLGAGKTTFVRGLAEGLGLEASAVSSPTFSIVHDYGSTAAGPPLLHLDLYRVPDRVEELRELGLPEILLGRIAAVEWPTAALRAAVRVTHDVALEPQPSGSRRIRIRREPACPR